MEDIKLAEILNMHNESLTKISLSIIEVVGAIKLLNEKVTRLERQSSIRLVQQDTSSEKKIGDSE